jgi:glycosyltransferase domain-containing protein
MRTQSSPCVKRWFFNELGKTSSSSAGISLLEELTVVIPSYNRQDYLLRQVIYWAASNVSVVIADGSETPLDIDIQGEIAKRTNIKYVHSPSSFADRMRLAGEMLSTAYAVLSGDDEFLLWDGLHQALLKLKGDGVAVACMGQSLGFNVDEKTFAVTYSAGYPHQRYEVSQSTAAARANAAMGNYVAATCYAVIKSDVWRRSWGKHGSWSSPYAGEIQQALATYIWGKLVTVDAVYWMRSSENAPVNTTQYNRGISFEEWWVDLKSEHERDLFIDVLATELTEAEDKPRAEAWSIVDHAVDTYVRSIQSSLNQDGIRSLVYQSLNRVLPGRVREWVKLLLFSFRGTLQSKGAMGTLKQMAAQLPITISGNRREQLMSDLSLIEPLIVSFHRARQTDTA